VKGAVSRTFKLLIAMVKFFLKMCFAVVKAAVAAVMFSAMLFGGLSAFLAVGPMHTPQSFAQFWNLLNEVDPARLMDALGSNATLGSPRDPTPLWEVRDPAIIISRWMVQFQPVTDLLATAAGVANDHWMRAQVNLAIQHLDSLVQSDPKLGQAVALFWVVSTVASLYLMMKLSWSIVKFFGRSLRRLVRTVCPARTPTSNAAASVHAPDGNGATPKVDLVTAPHALGETTRSNIVAETVMTAEKKGRRRGSRLESPHVKSKGENKEDQPPFMASPVRRKQTELSELRGQGLVGRRLGRN
jgi:hypothetical protein